MKNKNYGFTLAEVLITLSVIGVVAAISLPRFIDNMTERANSERHANIAQKVTQAMEQMRAHGLLNTPYASTDAFVDQLQNYLKIAKRCDSSHIADCWPTEKVTAGDGEEYKISVIKTGKHLQLQTETNNVGLVFADGSAIILNYNPNAQTFDVGDKITASTKWLSVGGKSKEFPYTSDVTGSIDFIMDVNGAKGPNSETINEKLHDIRGFDHAKIKGCLGTKIKGLGCVVELNTFDPVTDASESEFLRWYESGCGGNTTLCNRITHFDYWQGAQNACKKLGDDYKLPSTAKYTDIYNQKSNYSTLPQSGGFWTSSNAWAPDAWTFNMGNGNHSVSATKHATTYAGGGKLRVLCIDF